MSEIDHTSLSDQELNSINDAIKESEDFVKKGVDTNIQILSDEFMWDLAKKCTQYCILQNGKEFRKYQTWFCNRIIYSLLIEDVETITGLWARQCLPGNTIIFDRDGTALQIKDHKDAWYTGHREVFKVTVANGMLVRATGNHPFLTKRGWIPVLDLVPDDYLCILSSWDRLKSKFDKLTNTDNCYEAAEDGIDGEKRVWVKLKSVVPDGTEDVYDITFPGKGWFVANGFCVHNSGKTEVLATICAGTAIILPTLSKYLSDPRIQKYKDGMWMAIFGPTYSRAGIMYNRAKQFLLSKHSRDVIRSLGTGINLDNFRGSVLKLPNGSFIDIRTASPGSKLEGDTYHFVVMEEAQDISNTLVRKSITPMISDTAGTRVKIGTPTKTKNHFYDSIKRNVAADGIAKIGDWEDKTESYKNKLHFEFDWKTVVKYAGTNRYEKVVKKVIEEFESIGGENSEDFKMAYCCKWSDSLSSFLSSAALKKCSVIHGASEFVYGEKGEVISEFKKRALTERSEGDHPVIIAGDFGKMKSSTVLTAGKVWLDNPIKFAGETRYRIHILDWLEIIGDDHELQHKQILEFVSRYPTCFKFVGDGTGKGDPIISRLRGDLEPNRIAVVPFIFSKQSKHEGYGVLEQEINSGRITWPYGKTTKTKRVDRFYQQLEGLEVEWVGNIRKVGKPEDESSAQDDYPDSLMMLCWGANKDRRHISTQLDYNPLIKVDTRYFENFLYERPDNFSRRPFR